MSTPTIRVIDFYTKFKRQEDGSTKAVDYVIWAPAGGAMYSQTPERVSDLIPPASFDDENERVGIKIARMRAKWEQIEPAYMAWKNGKEIPESGTPLAAWAGLSQEQVKVIQLAGIRTVEDFAAAADNVLDRVRLPNKRELQRQANAFLDARDQTAAADALVQAENKIAALEAQMGELLAALSAQTVEAEEVAEKPKRGRPRKEESEAA